MIEHDKEWLKDKSRSRKYWQPHDGIVAPEDYAKHYHEHMVDKQAKAINITIAESPDHLCVNCNYFFKGPNSCKCGMRITEKMAAAVNRWRPLSEKPGDGERVEVLDTTPTPKNPECPHINSEFFTFGVDFDTFDELLHDCINMEGVKLIAWRPAPLPSEDEIKALMEKS